MSSDFLILALASALLVSPILAGPATRDAHPDLRSSTFRQLPTSLSGANLPSRSESGGPLVMTQRDVASSVSTTWDWWNITSESNTTLPIFWFTQGTWDESDGYLLFYGGDNFAGTNLGDTWTYSDGEWSKRVTNGTPGPLDGPALAYDPSADQVVMYGGLQSYSPFHYTNLTWVYHAGNWTSAHLNPTPPPRLAGTMVYDPDLGGTVLFGGYNNSDPSGATLLNDLWLYKAGNWSKISTSTAPPLRTWAPLAYDPGLHELVLYSGVNVAGQCIGDTWTYGSGGWARVSANPGGPPHLCANILGYDPLLGHVVLTGGLNSTSGATNLASWEFNGSAWSALNVSGLPAPHEYGVSAWDPVGGSFVVAGGWPSGSSTDVLSTPLSVSNISGPTAVDLAQPAIFQVSVTGGVPHRNISWDWGDGTSSAGDPSPSHTFVGTGEFNVSVTVTDATLNSSSSFLLVQVVLGPRASILSSTTQGDVGIPISFSGTVSGGSGTPEFLWDFGDGGGAAGNLTNHSYDAAGNYTVTLEVIDSFGGTGSAELNLSIVPAPSITFGNLSPAEVGLPVQLNASVSDGTPPVQYYWLFDDGTASNDLAPSHIFETSGTHLVELTVVDSVNGTSTLGEEVTVAEPLSVSIGGPGTIEAGSAGTWTAQLVGGAAPFGYSWVFPQGPVQNGSSAGATFAQAGTEQIELTVTDAAGASNTSFLNVSVSPAGSVFGGSVAGIPTLAIVGVVLLVVVLAAVFLIRRRSRT